MKWIVAFAGAVLAGSAFAQPVQPQPASSTPVGTLLASAPAITISNGKITANLARIDAARGFYNGTRFDQAGVVTSLILNGKNFYGPWFERLAPSVLDYTYVGDDVVAGPDSATSGPVEEFAPLDFEAKPGLFVKIGVGVLYQPDTQPYDHDKIHTGFINPGSTTRRAPCRISRELESPGRQSPCPEGLGQYFRKTAGDRTRREQRRAGRNHSP